MLCPRDDMWQKAFNTPIPPQSQKPQVSTAFLKHAQNPYISLQVDITELHTVAQKREKFKLLSTISIDFIQLLYHCKSWKTKNTGMISQGQSVNIPMEVLDKGVHN